MPFPARRLNSFFGPNILNRCRQADSIELLFDAEGKRTSCSSRGQGHKATVKLQVRIGLLCAMASSAHHHDVHFCICQSPDAETGYPARSFPSASGNLGHYQALGGSMLPRVFIGVADEQGEDACLLSTAMPRGMQG
jgi:hypothetical protein